MRKLLTILFFFVAALAKAQTPQQEYFALLGQSSSSYDADAQNYFDREEAAGYTMNSTEKNAVNTFIIGLKSNGLYTKISEMWLFMGSTAAPLGVAFKSASYNFSYVNALTYAATGITTNGTNSYINTNFIPAGNISFNNAHLAIYSRTAAAAGGSTSFDLGSHSGGSQALILKLRASDNTAASAIHSSTTTDILVSGNADGSGFFMGSRTSATHHILVRNGSVLGTQTVQTGTAVSSRAMFIGAYQSNAGGANGFTSREYCFASVGAGLTDSEAAIYSTLVNNLQTALGRNVFFIILLIPVSALRRKKGKVIEMYNENKKAA